MSPKLLLVVPLFLLTACSHQLALTVKSNDQSQMMVQPFSLTAMSGSLDTDVDIVLVAQGTEATEAVEPGKELEPVAVPPIRQVVYMRLHWRPYPGSTPDNPASSNVTVRWLLYPSSGPAAPTTDVVEYRGTAFVKPKFDDGGCTFSVLAGDIRPVTVKGRMTDVLGHSTFTGKFYAPYSSSVVQAVLKELPKEAADAQPTNKQ